jgi:1,4-dihydroxy-2-naphthoate octaprenyltransferase
LSEEAKLEYLRERIKEARSKEKEGIMLFIIGIAGSFIIFSFLKDIFFSILMVILIAISIVQMVHFNRQKEKLMEQLREMGYKEKEELE